MQRQYAREAHFRQTSRPRSVTRYNKPMPTILDAELVRQIMPQNATAIVRCGDEFIAIRSDEPLDLQAALDEIAERNLTQEMVNKTTKWTGIHNTIFVSPKGQVRHDARIKVAIDPPVTYSPHGKTCSVSVETGDYVIGERMDSKLARQVKRFVELNRETLLDFWHYRIGNDELDQRLRRIDTED
jgi:hypothetical protein